MIRIPQKVHGFSDLSRIFQPTFSIYKFLWIPVKNVLFFATVLVSIIFFDVNFFERSRIFIAKWAFLFTKVQYLTVIGVNFINNVVFYSVVTRFFFYVWFSFKGTSDSRDSRGREWLSLFTSIISTLSRTFRHLFTTLHLRWIQRIFDRLFSW